jgi:spermidine/putrescine transport system substrate-binding protein
VKQQLRFGVSALAVACVLAIAGCGEEKKEEQAAAPSTEQPATTTEQPATTTEQPATTEPAAPAQPADTQQAAATPAPLTSSEEKKLLFYNWTNYFPPDLLDTFKQETGIEVTMDGYDSNETLQAKLQAGGAAYDIVVPSDYMVELLAADGLLKEVNASTLPNWSHVNPNFQDPPYDPGRKYTIPYMWGTTGFSYDTAQVQGGKLDETWKEFFEPRAELEGKIASLDDQVELYNAAAYYLGVDKCTENAADSQKILDLLLAQKPKLAMYNSDGTIERMTAGEVAMHLQWNGAAHRTKEGRTTVQYVYPKEGIGFWQDNVAVPKDAPHPENAKIFLNWLMKPETAAAISNFTGYMNAIDGSDAFLDPKLKEDPAVNMPDDYADRLRPTKSCSVAARELRDKVWTALKK